MPVFDRPPATLPMEWADWSPRQRRRWTERLVKCQRSRYYPTPDDAAEKAKHHDTHDCDRCRNGYILEPFKCRRHGCDGWHLGHRSPSTRIR